MTRNLYQISDVQIYMSCGLKHREKCVVEGVNSQMKGVMNASEWPETFIKVYQGHVG